MPVVSMFLINTGYELEKLSNTSGAALNRDTRTGGAQRDLDMTQFRARISFCLDMITASLRLPALLP
jgi:hypothetical protein